MKPTPIYVDYNATTPVRPEVREAMVPLLFGGPEAGAFGNASSVHWAGQRARKQLESARTRVAEMLGRKPSEILFTRGGTEADNLALFGALRHRSVRRRRLITSAVEHPAVLAAATRLEEEGVEVVRVPVDREGLLDLELLDRALQEEAALVSVMAVNNETGVISPIDAVAARTKARGVLLHVDAVQAAGRTRIPIEADLITLSGHKLGGPKGVGVLAIREDIPLRPEIVGGPQERGKRAGTEDVAGAVGMAEALARALADEAVERLRLGRMIERLDQGLAALPGVQIVGRRAPRVANTTCALFAGVEGEAVLQGLDLAGVAASSGSACSSGSLEPSHVLKAMGYWDAEALSAVRISLGWATAVEDVDRVLTVLPEVLHQVRSATPPG